MKNFFTKNTEEHNSDETIEIQEEKNIKKPAFIKADKKIPLRDVNGNKIISKGSHPEESLTEKIAKNSGPLK